MSLAIQIFGILGAILVASLGIPQLFKIIKDKKTGDVNFLSFWIFHTGILLWVLWSAFSANNLHNVLAANGITLVTESVMLYLMYKYKIEFDRKQKLIGQGAVALYLILGFIFIGLHIAIYTTDNLKNLTWPSSAETTMGFVFPAFTTLAFLPQFIQSIKTNKWGGLSYGMFIIYITNNFVWIIWWALLIISSSQTTQGVDMSYVGGIIWQLISFSLFSTQFIFTIKNTKR
ncbi:hypothetical protein MCANUFG4_00200 [Mycoplasmopsis canis UFG4]|uniref:PQ loop repeat family protein n=1 Tax=Mycoplasmopsis canis UFG4 TaxID=1131455 RepID=I1A7J0_9BACT|nr:PQ-loop domain-containing transporter [Mycoplasmopsis canis]EIE42461.1 hypothetical protein MCANUFG4_00200 [Mycoplasmopsis canis UFG4]